MSPRRKKPTAKQTRRAKITKATKTVQDFLKQRRADAEIRKFREVGPPISPAGASLVDAIRKDQGKPPFSVQVKKGRLPPVHDDAHTGPTAAGITAAKLAEHERKLAGEQPTERDTFHDEVGPGITDAAVAKQAAKRTLDQAIASHYEKQPRVIALTEPELVARLQEAHRGGRECVLYELRLLGRSLAHVADQVSVGSSREANMAEKKLREKAIDIEVWLPQVEENAKATASKKPLEPWLLSSPVRTVYEGPYDALAMNEALRKAGPYRAVRTEEPPVYDHLAKMDALRMTKTGRTQCEFPNVSAVAKTGPSDAPPR